MLYQRVEVENKVQVQTDPRAAEFSQCDTLKIVIDQKNLRGENSGQYVQCYATIH